VDVDHDAHGRVHLCQLLNDEARRREGGAAAAVLLGNLDAHQPVLKEPVDHVGLHLARLVHRLDHRPHALPGEA